MNLYQVYFEFADEASGFNPTLTHPTADPKQFEKDLRTAQAKIGQKPTASVLDPHTVAQYMVKHMGYVEVLVHGVNTCTNDEDDTAVAETGTPINVILTDSRFSQRSVAETASSESHGNASWNSIPMECFQPQLPSVLVSNEQVASLHKYIVQVSPHVDFKRTVELARSVLFDYVGFSVNAAHSAVLRKQESKLLSTLVTAENEFFQIFDFSVYVEACQNVYAGIDMEEYEEMHNWYMKQYITSDRYYQYQKQVIAGHFLLAAMYAVNQDYSAVVSI